MTRSLNVGQVDSLWRYPVKSMQGTPVEQVGMDSRGIWGDRIYGLVDVKDQHVVSAKNPRQWPDLLNLRARLISEFQGEGNASQKPPVQIHFPNGRVIGSDAGEVDVLLSQFLGKDVTLRSLVPANPVLQQYRPSEDDVIEEPMPSGTFFDVAPIHVLTTATLQRLQELHPEGSLDVRRFRPNVVIATPPGQSGFIEREWVGRELKLGETTRLKIISPCPRCVMTTLAQPGLPADPQILRNIAQQAEGAVGVYAEVVQPGTVRQGAPVYLEG